MLIYVLAQWLIPILACVWAVSARKSRAHIMLVSVAAALFAGLFAFVPLVQISDDLSHALYLLVNTLPGSAMIGVVVGGVALLAQRFGRTSSTLMLGLLFATACAPEAEPAVDVAANEAPAAAPPTIAFLNSGALPETVPFSEAVRIGNVVQLSGQIGTKPGEMSLVPGGMEAEARQTLDNVRATLAQHGLGMDDVVKCTVMLADMSQWGAFNAIYATYFSPPYPARSAMGVNGLAIGAQVELECMAVDGAAAAKQNPARN